MEDKYILVLVTLTDTEPQCRLSSHTISYAILMFHSEWAASDQLAGKHSQTDNRTKEITQMFPSTAIKLDKRQQNSTNPLTELEKKHGSKSYIILLC